MSKFISIAPIITSTNYLTNQNLIAAGIEFVTIDLSDLIFKPGIEVLKSFKNIREFCKFTGKIILLVPPIIERILVSPFNGIKQSFSKNEILALIEHLQADFILCKDQEILEIDSLAANFEFSEADNLSKDDILDMKKNYQLHISNWVIKQSSQGVIFNENGLADITKQGENFKVVEACRCPTCQLNLTQSYLSYLYSSTPKLCYRYLVIHNCFYLKNSFT